mmetsp:Transcript_44705/g.72861  ORF Transcript_44705/g.72861 Transcript_44705/m.72861 type:complete len:90 (-) Transcript_44705:712-981(-)
MTAASLWVPAASFVGPSPEPQLTPAIAITSPNFPTVHSPTSCQQQVERGTCWLDVFVHICALCNDALLGLFYGLGKHTRAQGERHAVMP